MTSARDGQPPRSSKPPRGNEAPRRTPRSENRGWFQAFLRTPKGTLTALFAVILAVAGTATGWPQVLPHVLVAILGAFGVELMASTVVNKKLTWPTSALLSGAIVAFVLAPETPLVETVWIAGLASASKYLLRTSRGHIFNPAAFALLISIPLFATGQSWWGAGGDLSWPFVLLVLAAGRPWHVVAFAATFGHYRATLEVRERIVEERRGQQGGERVPSEERPHQRAQPRPDGRHDRERDGERERDRDRQRHRHLGRERELKRDQHAE